MYVLNTVGACTWCIICSRSVSLFFVDDIVLSNVPERTMKDVYCLRMSILILSDLFLVIIIIILLINSDHG